jgi:acetylornithine/N-succinyldiaminopimelate aminotransferase
MRRAISPATAAILIEGIQGEGGLNSASPEYLIGLRKLCNDENLLLLMDGVQDGYFRTGRFQCFQRILEDGAGVSDPALLPDGISMAKSLGGGFPIGAFWVRAPYADLLAPGSHGTTYGGTPLGCAVALKILEVIRSENLPDNARRLGEFLKNRLLELHRRYPGVVGNVRGLGLMIGFELVPNLPNLPGDRSKTAAVRVIQMLHSAGLLAIPAGAQVVRLLPALNLSPGEAEEGLQIIGSVVAKLAG